MGFKDPDYDIYVERFWTRIGAISLLKEIYDNTHHRRRTGRLLRRASDPIVGRPGRHPIQSDDRFEIRRFTELLDDYRVDYENIHTRADLCTNLIDGFEYLGFWHFYSRFPENQRLQRLHNLFKRYFHLLRSWLELPGHFISRRFLDPSLRAATTVDRFSYLVWSTVNGFSALPSKNLDLVPRHPRHRALHRPSGKNLKFGLLPRFSLPVGARVRFGKIQYREIPKANIGRPVRDIWQDLQYLTNSSILHSKDTEVSEGSSPEFEDDDEGEDEDGEYAMDEGYDYEQSYKFGEPIPEDALIAQPIADFLSANAHFEDLIAEHLLAEQLMFPSNQDSSSSSSLRQTRAGTPHPGKLHLDEHGDLEEVHDAADTPSMGRIMSPSELDLFPSRPLRQARAGTPHPGNQPRDENADLGEAHDTSDASTMEQMMLPSEQGSSPLPPLRQARAGTPHPGKQPLEEYADLGEGHDTPGTPSTGRIMSPSELDLYPFPPLREIRPRPPHPGKRTLDDHEDREEVHDASGATPMEKMMSTFRLDSSTLSPPQPAHDASASGTSSHPESGVSLPSAPKRARRRSPVAPVINIEPLAAAFGPVEHWPAVVDITVQRQDHTHRAYSSQIGTHLQFGHEAPYYARFNGTHWVLTPCIREGKRHRTIATTHRGLEERGSEMLWRFNRWDARRNFIQYIPKHDPTPPIQWFDPKGKTPMYRASSQPFPLTQWSDLKGKTPIYRASGQPLPPTQLSGPKGKTPVYRTFGQNPPAQTLEAKGKTPVYRDTRIDSVISDLRRVSIAQQVKRKRKTRRWTIDMEYGTLRRIPCCKRSEAPQFHDQRYKHLGDIQDYDRIYGLGSDSLPVYKPDFPPRAPLKQDEAFHLRMATVMQRRFATEGHFRSWEPMFTRESRPPAFFNPFDAAARARWYEAIATYVPPKRLASVYDSTTGSWSTEPEGESSLTFPPNLNSVALPSRNPEAGLSNELLVDTQLWRNWQEPELKDTVGLATIEEAVETMGAEKVSESRVQELEQDSPAVMEVHDDGGVSGQPPGEPMREDPQPESSSMARQPSAQSESHSFRSAGGASLSPEEDAELFAMFMTDEWDSDVGIDSQRLAAEILQRKKAGRRRKGGSAKFQGRGLRGGYATTLQDVECDSNKARSLENAMTLFVCLFYILVAMMSICLLIPRRRAERPRRMPLLGP
ncbi:hypothetical protein EV356DRAFT_535156 [Viridothelium virens]|uniref:Uncharacterized protein n=1 Tax=Viridothelium virens TaxID=1048519 RepID=A0A6A6H1Q5_VIRVR|nr:hypothetical protein EV356DRAFT_535156 [Viridothelium virens]